MPLGQPDDPRVVLPFAEQQALASANALLCDWAFDALEDLDRGVAAERLELVPFLPPAYRAAYGAAFFRRFLVCLTSVGLKLRLAGPQTLACTAEELALLTMTLVAPELLLPSRDPASFGVWFAAVCPRPRAERLYREPAPQRRSLAASALRIAAVERWFAADSPAQVLPPYLDPELP